MKEWRRRFNRMASWKNLFPRTLWSLYRLDDGSAEFCIWKQWLWRVWDTRRFRVLEAHYTTL